MNTQTQRRPASSLSMDLACCSSGGNGRNPVQQHDLPVLAPSRKEEPERVAFVLLPGFSMAAFSAAVEPLRVANMVSAAELFDWSTFSIAGGQVESSSRAILQPAGSIQDATCYKNVVICGGLKTATLADDQLFKWLRRVARFGVSLGALCTGAFILARVGLLNGYRCTVHWSTLAAFREMFPLIHVRHDLYVVDGKRFSCVGGSSACDMMLQHIAFRHGRGLAQKTAQVLLHQNLRGPSALEDCPFTLETHVRDSQLRAALCEMGKHIEFPLSLTEIASSAGLSLRQLQRKFQQLLGVSPHAYYMHTRLKVAKHLLMQTDMPVTEVAFACGFVSPSHFSASFRKFSGRSPLEFQKSFSSG